MGTRHLIAVVQNKEYKVAQYGQWDGYPSGQGVEILKFLRKLKSKAQKFSDAVAKCSFLSQTEIGEINATPQWKHKFPWLSRDAGADVLQMVLDNDGLKLLNKLEFAADSIFCEWAYVIDLDANQLEVFKGFNKTPLGPTERFFSMPGTDGYHPVKLVKSYPLTKLPTSSAFIKELEKSEE